MRLLFVLVLLLSLAFAATFSVDHTRLLYAGEDNDYMLQISNSANQLPVSEAEVELYKGTEQLAMEPTDRSGIASFVLHPTETGIVAFRLVHPAYNEYIIFQEITVMPTPTPTPKPTIEPETNQTSASITGFLTMNPSDRGLFLFVMLVTFVCLFAGSYLYYKNFFESEGMEDELPPSDDGAWEVTEAFSSLFEKANDY